MLRRAFAAAALTAVAVFVGPMPIAWAHATLLFTTPAVDGAVPTSPESIQLVFDQEVVASGSELRLSDDAGRSWRLGVVEAGSNGQTVTAGVLDTLPVGAYVVRWRATASDADVMLGEFRFAVGSTSGLSLGAGSVATEGVAATTVLRWLLFAGLALSLGGLLGRILTDRANRHMGRSAPDAWLRLGALLGVAASAALALFLVGGGSMLDGIRGLSGDALTSSTPGRLAVIEAGAFGVAFVMFSMKRNVVAGAVLLLVPLAEGLRAHPQAVHSGLGAMVTAVHVAAAAIWIGALIQVIRVGVAWRRQGISAATLVGSYARLALWLFLTVVITGSIAVLVLIPLHDLTSTLVGTTYGRWLLAKLVLVGLVAVLALWARARLRRRATDPQPSRSASWEVAGLGCVLGISGLLTALAPPVQANLPLPFPPAAVGPVVAVGSRAGFIGVGVTASNGQLLVRLRTPDQSPAVDAVDDTHYALTGNVSQRGDESLTKLRFRVCGTGCFVAPATWSPGLTTVTLATEDTSGYFAGGTTAVSIAWPPKPAPRLLKQIVAAMRLVRTFTLHEQVTSDTTQGLGTQQQLKLTGPAFLKSGPYGSGVAPIVTVQARSTAEATLALAYPGEGIYILLTADNTGRIIRERLAAPNHLVSRTFVYPELAGHASHGPTVEAR